MDIAIFDLNINVFRKIVKKPRLGKPLRINKGLK